MSEQIMMILQVLVAGLLQGSVYALISLGLSLMFGVLKIINFAHGDVLMLAMYSTFWLFHLLGLNPIVSILFLIPLFFVLGFVFYKGLIRFTLTSSSPVLAQVFATVGLSVFLQNAVLLGWGRNLQTIRPSYTEIQYHLGSLTLPLTKLIVVIAMIVIGVGLNFFLKKTFLGKMMRATSMDRDAVLLMGINVEKIYALTCALSMICIAIAGAMILPIYYVSPTVGLQFVLICFMTVVIGGMGSITGVIFGGLMIGVVESLAGFYVSSIMSQAIIYVMFLAVLLLKPAGLFGVKGSEEVGLK